MVMSVGNLQKRSTRLGWCVVLLSLGVATGNCADMFLTLTGIPGGSTQVGHVGAIEVLSMVHGIGRSISLAGKGGPLVPPTASQSELQFSKLMDKSTPLLYDEATRGGAIPSGEIDFVRTSSKGTTVFYKITLSQVYVSGISTSAGGSTPTDSVTLFYEKIAWSYIQVNGSQSAAGWDRLSNTGTNNFAPPPADSDADGLPDAWETQYFGDLSYGPNDDPDHDGLSNYQEYIAGTNPNDATSVLRVTEIDAASGQVHLTWNSVAGKSYTIYSANQIDGPYAPILTMPSAGDGETSTNVTGSASSQFYRVGVQ